MKWSKPFKTGSRIVEMHFYSLLGFLGLDL